MSTGTLQPTVAYDLSEATEGWDHLLNNKANETAASTQKNKMMQTINFKLGSFDDDKRTFTAIGSTPMLDRQDDIVDQAGWDLEHFKNNPVIPWAHDYSQPPVARAIEVGVVDGVLKFTYQAPPATMYEFADLIWNFYRNQYMFAFSVGFIPKEIQGNVLTECELLEISAVVVPANAQALALAYKSGDMDIRQAKQLAGKLKTAVKGLDDMIQASKPVEKKVESMAKIEITEEELAKMIDTKVKQALQASDLKTVDGAAVKTKDTITEELIEGEVREEKYEAAHEIMELWWAFCDAYYDEETPAENLNTLLTELIGYLQQFVAGTYSEPGENEDDNESETESSGLRKPLQKKDAKKIKEFISNFLSKRLTDSDKEKHNKTMADKDKGAGSSNSEDIMKDIHDYLKDMGDMLMTHTEALNEHAKTMTDHAKVIADYTAGLTSLAKQIPPAEDDDEGDDKPDKLNSSSDDVDGKTKDADDQEGEVKSAAKGQADGADQDEESDKKDKKANKPAASTDGGSDDDSEDDDSEDDEDDDTTATGTKGLADDSEVDPENLTDEEAEAIIKAVNEALAEKQ